MGIRHYEYKICCDTSFKKTPDHYGALTMALTLASEMGLGEM